MSSKKKTNLYLQRFGYFLFLLVIMVLFASTIFEGKDIGWGKWVYQYQTLITGITAIGAAWLTIYQMKAIDQRQAEHSEAAMALTIRGDFLKVSRLSSFVQKNLPNKVESLEVFRNANKIPFHQLYKKLIAYQLVLPDEISSLRNDLRSFTFTEAEPLFNAHTQHLLRDIRSSIQNLMPLVATLDEISQGGSEDDLEAIFHHEFQEIVDEIIFSLASLPKQLSDFIYEIQRLEKIYRRVADKSDLLREL